MSIKVQVTGGYSAARTGEVVDRLGGSFAGVTWKYLLLLKGATLPAVNAAAWLTPDSVDTATTGIAKVNFVIPSNQAVGQYRLAIKMTTANWTEVVVAEDDFIDVS
jgi:hypothetical protein